MRSCVNGTFVCYLSPQNAIMCTQSIPYNHELESSVSSMGSRACYSITFKPSYKHTNNHYMNALFRSSTCTENHASC